MSADPAALLSLADRCEREEPSRELDREIAIATGDAWQRVRHGSHSPPLFTDSIDAATALVPKGTGYMMRDYGDGAASAIIGASPRGVIKGKASVGSNPALALCAAALRARAAQ